MPQTRHHFIYLFLVVGNPDLSVKSSVTVKGFKPEIDNTQWIATNVTLKLYDSGLTAQVECEQK